MTHRSAEASWKWRSPTLLALVLTGMASAHALDVPFRQAFEAASNQDVMVVTVPDSGVLVMEPGSFFTGGKRLVIVAAQVRLEGETRIGFYPPSSQPPSKPGVAPAGGNGAPGADRNCSRSGCRGNDGAVGAIGETGDTGAPGASMLLDVRAIAGTGKLVLATAGQAGGKAQKGGKGGTGGRGGDGAEISCYLVGVKAGAGDGGQGGTGGNGGRGGVGGRGGSGGTVTVSADLATAIQAGRVSVDLAPARGGGGGEPGDRGNRGGAGSMGSGGKCGGGGRSGTDGADGQDGSIGESGPDGTAGSLRYWIGNESYAEGVTPQRVVKRYSLASRNLPKDCPATHTASWQVLPPPGQTVIALEPPRLVGVTGAIGVATAPILQPATGTSGAYEMRMVLRRLVVPVPQFDATKNPPLIAHLSCPPLKAEAEVAFLVVPTSTVLGSKLEAK